MAEQTSEAAQVAVTFPDPPPFWRDFTPDRLRTLETLRKERGAGSDNARLADIPADLINLQPPAEPADGTWRVFGEEQTVSSAGSVLLSLR
jgi:mediator of RNA polymerase II transcription subunit 7